MTGGYLGGLLADKLSPRLAIVLTPLLYLTALMAIPAAINSGTVLVWC